MKILHESRYTFAIECRFNELHFELFQRIFLLFHIHTELSSVISMNLFIHLSLLHPLIPIWLRNWYRATATKPFAPISTAFTITLYSSFSSFFLRSPYLPILYSWFWSIRFSLGIDISTKMILRFTLDKTTMSGRKCFLDMVFGSLLCHPGRSADTFQFPLDQRRFWPGKALYLVVC